jgi:IPT/TIG domain
MSGPNTFCFRQAGLFAAYAFTRMSSVFGQSNSHVTAVYPASGKLGDQVTITGEDLGKSTLVAVFLSDDKNDYKATVVDQEATKIVFKVPRVKDGDYDVSIQVGGNILIQPVRFSAGPATGAQ